jgi:hypothetical protein
MLLTLCRTSDGIPVDDRTGTLLSVEVPRGAEGFKHIPKQFTPEAAGIDLSAFKIKVKAGDVLAFTVRESKDAGYTFGLVRGHTYQGGLCFIKNGINPWRPEDPPCNLYFRVYVLAGDENRQPATQTSVVAEARVIDAGPNPQRGKVIAEAIPHPPTPPPAIAAVPRTLAPLQMASRIFQSEGVWYLEFSQFNGSDRVRPINTHPTRIDALRVGQTIGTTIHMGGGTEVRTNYIGPVVQLGPNEGYIKQIPIMEPPPPGRYALSFHYSSPFRYANEPTITEQQCWLEVPEFPKGKN